MAPVTGVQIPHFDAMMAIAARCNEMTGLGYIGGDLILDKNKGPLLGQYCENRTRAPQQTSMRLC